MTSVPVKEQLLSLHHKAHLRTVLSETQNYCILKHVVHIHIIALLYDVCVCVCVCVKIGWNYCM